MNMKWKLSRGPRPYNSAAETALQPLILCFEAKFPTG